MSCLVCLYVGIGLHTIPELLLIVQAIGDFKVHGACTVEGRRLDGTVGALLVLYLAMLVTSHQSRHYKRTLTLCAKSKLGTSMNLTSRVTTHVLFLPQAMAQFEDSYWRPLYLHANHDI